ncbi:MAG: efflux RND transporter permease subunit [Fimbriimonadaceae bacterium]
MGLTRLALNRPVFILVLMVLAVFMGWRATTSMRVELQPEVSFGMITVITAYPGAGPDEVNRLISRRIEESVSGVNGIEEVTSQSVEGASVVIVSFQFGTNMDAALNDIRSKVDSSIGGLPLGAEKPIVSKADFSSQPILYLVLRSDKLSNQELRDLADDKLKDKFSRIAGVSAVNVSGGDVREIQIQVNKDKLLSYKIALADVQRAVQAATLNVPGGRVVTSSSEARVRTLGEFKTVAEIENMVLSVQDNSGGEGGGGGKSRVVRLKDIATITDTIQERREASRLGGSDSVTLVIQKTREGTAVDIAEQSKAIIPQIEAQYPGLKFVVTTNVADDISESLFDLRFALIFGILLVAAVVYVFLHNFRGTLIVATAIPICLMATFIVLAALGFSINMMTMLALSLAVGVLVDDAIVVLENIYRHLRMGEDPRDAAINGRSEIGLAAIAITLVDVVVWIPIAFMGGVVGQFFRPLGIGFAVAVLMSLFVSFTVTPMLASRWYRKGEDLEHPTGRFAVWFERNWTRFANFYGRILEWSLNHRWFIFISGFVVLVAVFMVVAGSFSPTAAAAIGGAMGPFQFAIFIGVIVFFINGFRKIWKPRLILNAALFGSVFLGAALLGFSLAQWKKEPLFKGQFMPQSDPGSVGIAVQMPPGTSLSNTQAVIERIEGVVSKHPEAKYVLSTVGSQSGGFGGIGSQGSNYGQVRVTLHEKQALLDQLAFWAPKEEKLRTRSSDSIAAELLEQIGRIPGAEIKVAATEGEGFGSPIQMSFRGDDPAVLVAAVSNIKEKLKGGAIKGVINPDISSKPGNPEIRVIPDRLKLADVGRTPADVANAMRMLYEGDDRTIFRVGGREYKIRVMMSLKDRNNPDIVNQLPLLFVQGNPVFLSQVARIEPGIGLDKIERRDRQEEVRLTADLLPGMAAANVQAQIDKWLKDEKLVPEGVNIVPLGQAQAQAREMPYMMFAFGLAILLVYMVLASLFDNLLYPFVIQLAQPQAMVGALLALMITDKALNIVGFIGIMTLVGLVGKNAILLVDFTNTLRARGRTRHDALVEAGPIRLRPIMMTTLAIVFGMLPVALAIGRGSEFRETIGITIIGGIIVSTMLTLLVIPCSYSIFDDFSNWLGRIFGGRAKGSKKVQPPSPPRQDDPLDEPEPVLQPGS